MMIGGRRWTKGLLAAVVLAASVVGGAGPDLAAPGADPATAAPPVPLAVTPSTGLVDAQQVTITTPAAWMADPYRDGAYLLCATASADNGECTMLADSSDGRPTLIVAIPARFFVARTPGSVTTVDCRTTSCSIRAAEWTDADLPVTIAAATLGFAPGAPLRTPPTITANPTTGLIDGQNLTVSVSPSGQMDQTGEEGSLVFQCARPLNSLGDLADIWSVCSLDSFTVLYGPVGGVATGPFRVSTYVATADGPVDCRAPGATCVLLTVDAVGQLDDVALDFDPTAPVEPALLERYSDDFESGTFDLVGFTPGDPFSVRWCNDAGACLPDSMTIARGTLGADGTATFALVGDPFPAIGSDTDLSICRESCQMTAMDAHGLTATGGYGFSSGDGPGSPFSSEQLPVTVTPHKDLSDGSVVTVTASGFTPGASVSIIECTGTARISGSDACDFDTSSFLNGQTITADAAGNISATYTVRRHIGVGDGPVDCADGNVDPDAYVAGVAADPSRETLLEGSGYFSCIIGVANLADYSESGGTPIAFAGARFRPLPWQVVPDGHGDRPRGPHGRTAPPAVPGVSQSQSQAGTAPVAMPVTAQPAFTG